MLKMFFKKFSLFFLLWAFSSSVCFSEKVYTITESELETIATENESMKKTIEKQYNRLIQLETLSSELRQEAETERQRAEKWKRATLTISLAVVAGGFTCYFLNK